MFETDITFTAKLRAYKGKAAWYFITLPKKHGEQIRFFSNAEHGGKRRGFGAVKVRVTIGDTTWETSLFPDSRTGSYLLPVKAAVRKAEGLADGKAVKVALFTGVQ